MAELSKIEKHYVDKRMMEVRDLLSRYRWKLVETVAKRFGTNGYTQPFSNLDYRLQTTIKEWIEGPIKNRIERDVIKELIDKIDCIEF